MRFKNIAKSVIAATALTVASFGANAGATASSALTITDFGLVEQTTQGYVPFSLIDISESDFFGSTSSAQTDIVALAQGDYDHDGLGYANFELEASDSNSSSSVDFEGAHFDGLSFVGSMGTTQADATVLSHGTAHAEANLENTAEFTVGNGDDVLEESFDVFLTYTYALALIADEFGLGGTAEASGVFQILLIGGGLPVFDIVTNVSTQNTPNIDQGGTEFVAATLTEGVNYTLFVTQTSDVDVTSVPEPSSVAILGLGLLGLAGAARRRKA